MGSNMRSQCAISPNGNILVSSSSGHLLCYDVDGENQWSIKIGFMCRSAPSIDSNGNIYIGSDDGLLCSILPDGTKSWETNLDGKPPNSPGIYNDERIFIGTDTGSLYCIDTDGDILWNKDVDYGILSDPIITDDGKIILNTGIAKCYDLEGNILWSWNTVSVSRMSPSLGRDLIFISSVTSLCALGPFRPTSPQETIADQIGRDVRIRWEKPILDGGVDILEYPTWDHYREKLKEGYDIVGISFFTWTFPAMVRMVEMARAAGIKEVWGGNYGMMTPGAEAYFDKTFSGYCEAEIYHTLTGMELKEIRRIEDIKRR
jgi:outer membrane protein assembly factor BamB